MGSAKRPAAEALQPPSKKKAKKAAGESGEKAGKAGKDSGGKLSATDAKAFFETNDIKVHVPESKEVDILPLEGFKMKGFAKTLVKYCEGKFSKPTPIQAICWPIAMQRTDLCGIAKTGSGKTLAFVVPYLSMSRRGVLEVYEQPCATPRFVAMAPTRELAMQIAQVCKDLSAALAAEVSFPVQCVYGGVPKWEQRKALQEEGVDLLVATPGRLQDLVEESAVDLGYVQYLVLDEADKMLDLGFIDAVKSLISKMPKAGERQTCMFSATWPPNVHCLSEQFLDKPVHVIVGSGDQGLAANTAIRQEVEVVQHDKEKQTRLLHHLKKHYAADKKVIIFGLYKKECAWLEGFLYDKGYTKVAQLQGDLTQEKRTKTIEDFKATRVTPLIATDVASRGLDINDVELVINYTFPLTIEDYVHRIGRTGRAGKKGLAVCFFCPDSKGAQDEKAHAGDLVKIIKDAGQQPPDDLLKLSATSGGNKATKKKAHPLFGAHFKTPEQMAALEAKKVHKSFADSDDE